MESFGRFRSIRLLGFTLVEMLAALAVIALLLGLLIPAFNRVLSNSKQASCLNNLRQLGMAARTFAYDYNGYMPDINWWAQDLLPYMDRKSPRKDTFWCPAATATESPVNASGNLGRYDNGGIIQIAYGINANFPTNNGHLLSGVAGTRERRLIINIEKQDKIVLFLDGRGGFANLFYNSKDRFSRRHTSSNDPNRMQLNAVFVDGHTKMLDMPYEDSPRTAWRSMFDSVFK